MTNRNERHMREDGLPVPTPAAHAKDAKMLISRLADDDELFAL